MPNATIPFDFRPSQVIQTTGSYTIPANKYAYVTAWATDTYVTVDGNNWLTSKRIRDTLSNSVPGTMTTIYTIEASGLYDFFIVATPASAQFWVRPWNTTVDLAITTTLTAQTYATFTGTVPTLGNRVHLKAGDEIRAITNGTYQWRLNGITEWDGGKDAQWFPTGTVLDGGNKIIALFDY